MNSPVSDFEALSPDLIIDSLENVLSGNDDMRLTGLLTPYPSYINRVYEVQCDDGQRLIAKFYRPGRWPLEAIQEEHLFLKECREEDIPVAAPLPLGSPDGPTLARVEGFPLAVFPKKAGRLFEVNTPEDYIRAGALIGRIHKTGRKSHCRHRITLSPSHSTRNDLNELLALEDFPSTQQRELEKIGAQLLALAEPLFKGIPLQRIHGDCHRGNILERPGEGLMMIDFDDMAMGPAVQDLWMLLPGHYSQSRREANLLLEGYSTFCELPPGSWALTESLRAMRMIYYLAWCARQQQDLRFQTENPQWGSSRFWQEELDDLTKQLREIEDHL